MVFCPPSEAQHEGIKASDRFSRFSIGNAEVHQVLSKVKLRLGLVRFILIFISTTDYFINITLKLNNKLPAHSLMVLLLGPGGT